MYWELLNYDAKLKRYAKENPRQALLMGDWKIVRPKPDAPLELYNLREDIGETRDVAQKKPSVLSRMQERMQSARTEPRPAVEPETEWWTRTS